MIGRLVWAYFWMQAQLCKASYGLARFAAIIRWR